MSAVDQAGEVRRLAAQNVSQREIAEQLGITRYQVRRVLGGPVGAQPPTVGDETARPAARATPTDDRSARADAQPPTAGDQSARANVVGDRERPAVGPPVEGVVVAAAPVGHMAGTVRFPLPGARSPWLRVDLSRRRGLLRDLVALARVGLRIPYVVEDVLRAFAAAYHEALANGHLRQGQGYEVHVRVRPCRHT